MHNPYDSIEIERLRSNSATRLEGFMRPDAPESLLMARLHQAELRGNATEHRRRHEGVGPVDGRAFSGINLKIGSLLIIVGRTISRPESDCPDAAGAKPILS
jgi:hypothetical protein